jgi:hypothetical protein
MVEELGYNVNLVLVGKKSMPVEAFAVTCRAVNSISPSLKGLSPDQADR